MAMRKVRRVSADWVHPKNELGQFVRLLDGADYARDLEDWLKVETEWRLGRIRGFDLNPVKGLPPVEFFHEMSEKQKLMSVEGYYGPRPLQESYMPQWTEAEATHYQMYETETEGRPISPAMETKEELAEWLSIHDRKADENISFMSLPNEGMPLTKQNWLDIIDGKALWTMGIMQVGDQQELHVVALPLNPNPS